MSAEEQSEFYTGIPPFRSFAEVAELHRYTPCPDGWVVVVTDVRNSTQAIAEGRYREVNVLGAASIACVINSHADAPAPPYVFGGDGSLALIPRARLPRVAAALNRLVWRAREDFGLELRAGAVPVADLHGGGLPVRVARYALSEHVSLAMLAGAGVDEAVRLVKSADDEPRYTLVDARPPATQAPVRGLNCRWKPVPTRNGEIVSLIVKATTPPEAGDEAQAQVYREVLSFLDHLGDPEAMRPIAAASLALGDEPSHFEAEATLKAGRSGPRHALRRGSIRLVSRVGALLIRKRWRVGSFDGATYPEALVAQSDYRKFDGALRMVIDATPAQRERLEAWLAARWRDGALVHGLASAPAALITCLVYDRRANHVHFVDGAEGGYALAALRLAERAALGCPRDDDEQRALLRARFE